MNKTIADFRKAGFKVHVDHRRCYRIAYVDDLTKKIVVKTVVKSKGEMGRLGDSFFDKGFVGVADELLPKGGKTEVTLTDPKTGLDIYASSDCHNDENYNKAVGVQKCLDRITDLIRVCWAHKEQPEIQSLAAFVS